MLADKVLRQVHTVVKDKTILQIAGRVTGDNVDKGSIINLFTFDTTVK